MTDRGPTPAQPERSPITRLLRRILVLAVGVPVTLLGIVLLVAPGPGTPLVIGGLAILAIEFPWAQRRMHALQRAARSMIGRPDEPGSA